jgi:hypothetical protein
MKIKATKKFSKLGSSDNWASFGKEKYLALESGKTVEADCPENLIKEGYVEEIKKKKKESE